MADEPPTVPETDDDLIEGSPLTVREMAWVEAFSNPESTSFGNATKSAELAGYADPQNSAWRLRRRPRVVTALGRRFETITAERGKVIAHLGHLRQVCEEKGDLAAAVRAVELMGKSLGLFRDAIELELPEMRAYSETEAFEARRLASMMLEGKPGELPAVEAEPLALPVHQEQAIGE